MIQIHGKTILSMEFKSIIKAHYSISWQIIYQKSPVLTSNIKEKPSSHWQYIYIYIKKKKKTQFSLATSKSPVLTSNSKSLIYVGTT